MKKFIFSLQQQKQFRLKSQGSSMMPILRPNDVVHYRKMPFWLANVNDLIMVRKNSNLFTHRVIYQTSSYLITKGDNNLESDGKIYPKQVIVDPSTHSTSFSLNPSQSARSCEGGIL